jgi:hypothetical protein
VNREGLSFSNLLSTGFYECHSKSSTPRTGGAAMDVEAQRKANHAFVRENMPPGWDGNPDEVIEAFKKHGERLAAAEN